MDESDPSRPQPPGPPRAGPLAVHHVLMAYDEILADRVREIAARGDDLEQWVSRGLAYARSLPPKRS